MSTNETEKKQTRRAENEKAATSSEAQAAQNNRDTRKKQKKLQKEEKRNAKFPRIRVFPIWLRIIVISILCVAALVIGLMVGYGVIGDGSPTEVLKKETWQHIIDIIYKAE
ncbi:DNA-directed RNA polymerase subunit beta [Oceanobacillus kimchii]|uniref:DNA-directed RNA polymerase subunit beta n=1 Tax=Oceanobacillus kimchii TaxID=746691 RepID=UPI0003455034|nr:DNA-directed RNA polymerase subunit beta [Oceanobacillus kimchii]